jgi:hypothetical protein
MSDSSPEDFMEQALKIITELKQALEASFAAQDKHIERIDANIKVLGEQVATQKNRIDTIAGNFTSLNNDFQKHTQNSHASKSYVTNAITTHAQSHEQELQNAGFISVATYQAKIQEFEGKIAKLEAQIKQPTTLSEEGKIESKVTEDQIETIILSEEGKVISEVPEEQIKQIPQPKITSEEDKAESVQTTMPVEKVLPPSSATPRAPTPYTSHQQPKSKTYQLSDDPSPEDLQTDILKAILKSNAYTFINNNNRSKILIEANTIKSENRSVSDDKLHMQVILALYYLSTKKETCRTFYKKCYEGNVDNLQFFRNNIVPDFIGNLIFSVNGSTFKSAIDDINFSTLIKLAYPTSRTDEQINNVINTIKGIIPTGAN